MVPKSKSDDKMITDKTIMPIETSGRFYPVHGSEYMEHQGHVQLVRTALQSIVGMPIYRMESPEELRLKDWHRLYTSKSFQEKRWEDYSSAMNQGFWTRPFHRDEHFFDATFMMTVKRMVSKFGEEPNYFGLQKDANSTSNPFANFRVTTSPMPFAPFSASRIAPFSFPAPSSSIAPFSFPAPASSAAPFSFFAPSSSAAPACDGQMGESLRIPEATPTQRRRRRRRSAAPFVATTSSSNAAPFSFPAPASSAAPFTFFPSSSTAASFTATTSSSTVAPFTFTTSSARPSPIIHPFSTPSPELFKFGPSTQKSTPFAPAASAPSSLPASPAAQKSSFPVFPTPIEMDKTVCTENPNPSPSNEFKSKHEPKLDTSVATNSTIAVPVVGLSGIFESHSVMSDVWNFIKSYEVLYEKSLPAVCESSYSAALDRAKRNGTFLLVYLHDDESPENDRFCRDTLSNSEVRRYINHHTLFWACNVQSATGSAVSRLLKMPAGLSMNALVVKDVTTLMSFAVEGLPRPTVLIKRLQKIARDNANAFEKMQTQAPQSSRFEETYRTALQDFENLNSYYAEESAKKASMIELASPELAEIAPEANRKQDSSTEEKSESCKEVALPVGESGTKDESNLDLMEIQILQLKKELAAKKLPPEPSIAEKDVFHVKAELGGSILNRRFNATDTTEDLYNWIFSQPELSPNFEIITRYPKMTIYPTDRIKSLRETGMAEREFVRIKELRDAL